MHKTSFELTMYSILHTSSTNYTHTLFLSPAYLEQVPAVWISVHHARLQKLRQSGVYTQLHQRHVGCGSPPTRAATASAAASLACRVVVMSATRDVCIPMPALQEATGAPADSKSTRPQLSADTSRGTRTPGQATLRAPTPPRRAS